MSKKNIYCTLDTETVGGATKPTGMYNLGAVIHDKNGNIFATTSILVMEHYEDINKDEYSKKNFPLYEKWLMNGSISAVATEAEAVSIVRNLCRFYGVKYVMAYNSSFDFCKTVCRDLLDEFEFIDLWLMATQTITYQKGFDKFCHENGLRAKKDGKKVGTSCSTTVETVYAYMTNNPNFEEEHTALSDAMQEMEIFVKCYSLHKKFTKNCHQWDENGKKAKKKFPKW